MSIALLEIFGKCPRKAARGPRKALRRVSRQSYSFLRHVTPSEKTLMATWFKVSLWGVGLVKRLYIFCIAFLSLCGALQGLLNSL